MMSKTPKLRFKEFSGDWESKRLGDICDVTMGQSPSSSCYNEENIGLPLIQGNADVKDRKTSPRIYTSDITKTCDVGDIIMSVRAPVGSISKSIHNACIGRGVCSIKPKQSNEFMYQFLLKYEDKWSRISQGSTFESVNRNDITDTKVKIPSIEEQEKIASFFSLIDDKISLQSEKLEMLKDYKKGMMQKIFSRELRFKDDDGRDYPEWEEKKLEDLFDFQYGQFNNNPDNGGKYPIYGANGIIGGYHEYNAEKSIIIGHMGAYAGKVIWEEGKHFVTYNGTIGKPKNNKNLIAKFGYYMLINKNIQKICAGSGQPFLSYSDLNNIKVLCPADILEQDKISKFLTELDRKLEKEQEKLDSLNEYKKGLLQQMFV